MEKQNTDVMQQVFSEGRFERLEDSLKTLKQIQFTLDTHRVQIDNCISKKELSEIYTSMKKYAPLLHFRNL